jgi:hypothetical protein
MGEKVEESRRWREEGLRRVEGAKKEIQRIEESLGISVKA